MPRVRFTQTFHWHPKRQVTIKYEAGREYLVTQRCAAEARAKGAAVYAMRERKDDPDAVR
jgi:hypothetical protein